MRTTIACGIALSLLALASAQVREVWRYVYTPPQDDFAAQMTRAVRLSDGGLMLLGWVETPLNGRDALAIRLLPDGTQAWVYQLDGAGFDDAFVDAVERANELRLLGQFTDADGYLTAQVHHLTPAGQPSAVFTLARTPNAHLRPLRFLYFDGLFVAAEEVASGVSRAIFYEDNFTNYILFNRVNIRPWGVITNQTPVYDFLYGSVASSSTAVDTAYLAADSAIFRYSGAARGVDIPAAGVKNPVFLEDVVGIQSEGGYTGEDVVLIYHLYGSTLWGYRYSHLWHDDYAESLAMDVQENVYLLVKTVLWRGEPFERYTLRLARFSNNGRLLSETELVDEGQPSLSGIVRVNPAGQRYVAVSGASQPPSFLARVNASGQPLWQFPTAIAPEELFAKPDGSLLVAGTLITEVDYYNRFQQVAAVKYAPSGDLDGNGCVDDADLLQALFAFGQQSADLAADINGDGVVDDADLLSVLFAFGQGC